MALTPVQTLVTMIALALGVIINRFLPFVLFPDHKQPPKYVAYLGNVLPPAVMALLVVYCLKGISLNTTPYGLPELLGIGMVVLLHQWKHNTLLSIAGGTIGYMLLVNFVFPA